MNFSIFYYSTVQTLGSCSNRARYGTTSTKTAILRSNWHIFFFGVSALRIFILNFFALFYCFILWFWLKNKQSRRNYDLRKPLSCLEELRRSSCLVENSSFTDILVPFLTCSHLLNVHLFWEMIFKIAFNFEASYSK